MPVPPPLPDPSHIESRLVMVAEMLEEAVAEVRRAMADIKVGHAHSETTNIPGSTDANV